MKHLWAHQERGIRVVLSRPATILNWGMRTGKSRVAIEVIRRSGAKRVLIVTPKSVVPAWERQFRLFGGDGIEAAVLPLASRSIERRAKDLRAALNGGNVTAITNYDAVWRAALGELVSSIEWDIVILDESHRIKAPGSRCSMFFRRVRARRKLCLTGTPMPHSPLDLYGQYRFLDPRIYGTSFALFRATYAVMGGFENREIKGWRNLDALRAKMLTIMDIVKRADVLDLPPAHHVRVDCPLPHAAQVVHDELRRELCAEWQGKTITLANALVKAVRLLQVTSGIGVFDEERPGAGRTTAAIHSAKADALRDILEDLDPKEPVVVFCLFRPDLDVIADCARAAGRAVMELSGRRNELAQWQSSGGGEVLACQIRSGKEGIDLSRASQCIYYSLGYSLGDYNQSLARIHGPDQTRPVTYHHLIAPRTADETLYATLRRRERVVTLAERGAPQDDDVLQTVLGALIAEKGETYDDE